MISIFIFLYLIAFGIHSELANMRIGFISETMDYPPIIEYELYDCYKNKFLLTRGSKSYFEQYSNDKVAVNLYLSDKVVVNLHSNDKVAVFETCFFVFRHKKIININVNPGVFFDYTLNIKSITYIWGDYKLFSSEKKYSDGGIIEL